MMPIMYTPEELRSIKTVLSVLPTLVDYSPLSEEDKTVMEEVIGRHMRDLNPTEKTVKSPWELAGFNVDCLIGYGSFGKIWKAHHSRLGEIALKQLALNNATDIKNAIAEKDLLVALKHPRINNINATFLHGKQAFLVLDLCFGSVAHLRNRISSYNAVRFGLHLLQAVDWIHGRDVVHADIKPDNCLIDTRNNLVLADFGTAVTLAEGDQVVSCSLSNCIFGYMDYDATNQQQISKKTDLFGAACVIYEMTTKAYLLRYPGNRHDRDLYVDAFENGRIIPLPMPDGGLNPDQKRESLDERARRSSFGPLLIDMIRRENPTTAPEALEHPTVSSLVAEFAINEDTLDQCDDFVTRDFNVDRSMHNDLQSELGETTEETDPLFDLAILGFSYDGEQICDSDHATSSESDDSSGSGDDDDDSDLEPLSQAPVKKKQKLCGTPTQIKNKTPPRSGRHSAK